MSLTFIDPADADSPFADTVIPDSATGNVDDDTTVGNICPTCGKHTGISDLRTKYHPECRPSRNTGTTPRSARGQSKDDRLKADLLALLTVIGTGVTMVDRFDGMVVLDRADKTADALVVAAQQSPQVRKALEQLTTVSAWGSVVAALSGMLIPIAAHHHLAPISEDAAAQMFLSPGTASALRAMYAPERAPEAGIV